MESTNLNKLNFLPFTPQAQVQLGANSKDNYYDNYRILVHTNTQYHSVY